MGVNKNISIFMLFDCVRVNTGLVFIESVIVGGKRGGRYMWIDDDINLESYFSITPVGRFWLVKTYQYGWHPSILSHHAIGTAECDESYCIEGGIFDRSFVGMRGILLPRVILRRERHHDHIWIFEHSNFLWRQFRGGVMSLYGIWAGLPIYGSLHPSTGF